MDDSELPHDPPRTTRGAGDTELFDTDIVVVGGGPAGCGVAVCTARYGLSTRVFDRGTSSLRQCAYLENFLGFPGGIAVSTFYELMHDHIEQAGATIQDELVTDVTAIDGGFRVTTQGGSTVTTPIVVAASTYDGSYLRGLDSDASMFTTHTHDGDTHEHFDSEYVEARGRTPIDGLYVAGGLAGHGEQALIAAGHGMAVGRTLIEDVRAANGWWDEIAPLYDWRRRATAAEYDLDDEETLDELFVETRVPDEHDIDQSVLEFVRDAEIATFKSTYIDRETVEQQTERGYERLLAVLDEETVLEQLPDSAIEEYVSDNSSIEMHESS